MSQNISMSVEETPQTINAPTNAETNAETNAATNAATNAETNAETNAPTNQVKLVDAVIDSQNMALNVMVGFIGVAQKRGVFSLDESAKLYECIKMFQGGDENQATN
jgi:hypothetical protein